MEKRVIFDSKENRNLFFKKTLSIFGYKKWSDLRKMLGVPKSTLEFYRNGKLTLPEKLYFKLMEKFEERDKMFFNKNIKFLDSNWGRIKAGKTTFHKHKHIFDKGRELAINFSVLKAERFDVNMSLDVKLAYFMGLFIGDGFTNKYAGNYLIQFTGDLGERKFYSEIISAYCISLFGITPKIKDDKYCKCIRINIHSKSLFEMITKRFKIAPGRKSHTVLIPEEILNSTKDIVLSCVRGLYDAEGCVFLDKRKNYKKPYPRIELHMCNLDILKQVSMVLTSVGIHNIIGTSRGNLRVTIWGFDEVKKFIKEIGFFNPKQLDKIRLVGLLY